MNDRVRDINDLDRVVHEPARLMIVTILSVVEAADFVYLLRETALNKGTLSSHLARLEEAGYVEIEKTFRGKVPQTLLRLTKPGRRAFEAYRKKLRGVFSEGSSPKRGIVTSSGGK
jgi:DNA-binding transcriptional ArsR family regulator